MEASLDRIAAVVCRVGGIERIGPDDDYFDAGLSSVRALELLIELENDCRVSIPDDQFVAARTVRALHDVVARIKQEQPV
jgi:acyl carrier protein